ncbi:carboxypeptidase-like regulatory domain-containing protein [Caulifigura coniformis]|nr:carboxypeptidase-like regulatory domain-containing protein [Caulifigura coniformis]
MRNLATKLVAMGMASFLLASGCSGAADEAPAVLVPATGVVKLKGQPLSGVSVSFIPDYDTKGTGGFAATDSEGKFAVKHQSGKDGIEPGRYRIVLSRMMKSDGSPIPSGESAMDHGGVETIPLKYTSPTTTPLQPNCTDKSEPMILELQGK